MKALSFLKKTGSSLFYYFMAIVHKEFFILRLILPTIFYVHYQFHSTTIHHSKSFCYLETCSQPIRSFLILFQIWNIQTCCNLNLMMKFICRNRKKRNKMELWFVFFYNVNSALDSRCHVWSHNTQYSTVFRVKKNFECPA